MLQARKEVEVCHLEASGLEADERGAGGLGSRFFDEVFHRACGEPRGTDAIERGGITPLLQMSENRGEPGTDNLIASSVAPLTLGSR